MTSSTRGHRLMVLLLRIGSLTPRLSEMGDGIPSSSFSLILKACSMAFTMASFTRGSRQHTLVTSGLDPPNWWDQEDGPSSNSSSSIRMETCTASKTEGFI